MLRLFFNKVEHHLFFSFIKSDGKQSPQFFFREWVLEMLDRNGFLKSQAYFFHVFGSFHIFFSEPKMCVVFLDEKQLIRPLGN